jgi:hypothetical protein
MYDDDILKLGVLLECGYRTGEQLPKALTEPSTVFVDKSGKAISNSGSWDASDRDLPLGELMEGDGFPLGNSQEALHGMSWINVFEKFAHHYPAQIENQLEDGLDIKKIVGEINGLRGPNDKISVLEKDGNYLVEDGKHRMSYLKVLYEMAMVNPDLSDEEKQGIKNIKLAVRVRPVAHDCEPKMGENSYRVPGFLPEIEFSARAAIARGGENKGAEPTSGDDAPRKPNNGFMP